MLNTPQIPGVLYRAGKQPLGTIGGFSRSMTAETAFIATIALAGLIYVVVQTGWLTAAVG